MIVNNSTKYNKSQYLLCSTVYTKSMPKLTGEELSKLYPHVKTYDELQADRARMDEQRRPKLVALKVAFAAALGVLGIPTVYLIYRMASELISGADEGSISIVMTAVFSSIFLIVVCLAVLYYLYTFIDSLASKTMAISTPFYLLLFLIYCAAGIVFVLLHYTISPVVIGGMMAGVFAAAFLLTSLFTRQP